ncbi:gigasin-6, partial [Biomphalaria pfeifferi]
MASFSLGFTVLVLFLAASRAPSSTWASVRAYANGAFPGIDDAVAEEIDQFVYHILPCHHSPALTLSIVKNGSLVLTKGYGFTSTNNTVNVTSRTKFAIGSLTKAFTATLIAKWLLDQNNITVDTPIKSYLPNFRVTDDLRSSRASLRDLLSHRMGLPSFFKALGMGFTEHMTRQMLVNRLVYMPTKHAFRHKLIYNNYMYAMAANVLERMSAGKSWEDILKDSIFRPLNMTNSGFLEELPNFSDFALPCAMVNGSKVDLSTELFKTVLPCGPAGSIYSNAEDMAKWMNFLLRKGLGPSGDVVMRPEVIQMTQEPGMLSTLPFHELSKPFYPVSHVSQSYDMGWITANYRGHRQVFHTGGIVTHSSRLWLYPDAHVGIYVSVNGPQDKQDLL